MCESSSISLASVCADSVGPLAVCLLPLWAALFSVLAQVITVRYHPTGLQIYWNIDCIYLLNVLNIC